MKAIKVTESGLIKFPTFTAVAGNTLAELLEIPHKNMMRCINRALKKSKQENLTAQK